jgi:tetratricopeptide (TPR) repeat protein
VNLAATALEWADDLDDPFTLGFAHFARAGVAISFFDLDAAARDLNVAIGIFDELGVPGMRGFARLNLGHIHLYRGEFELAQMAYEEAQPLAALVDDHGWVATSALYGFGEAQQVLGDDRAADTYRRALESYRALGDARGAVLAALRLAQLNTEAGDRSEGDRYLGFAKSHRRFHDEAALRACIGVTEAFLDCEAGRIGEARITISQVKALASGIGAPLGPIDSALLSRVEARLATAG